MKANRSSSSRAIQYLAMGLITALPLSVAFAGPPPMPRTYDEATVQHLIDTIDQPHQDMILKIGYFSRRHKDGLPEADGYKLLQAAVAKETPGSKRWFYLEAVAAAAPFRSASLQPDDGYHAFNALFDRAGDAANAGAVYVLRQSVAEFVSDIGTHFRWLGLRQDPRTVETLGKAWTAYAFCVHQTGPEATARTAEPPWSTAIALSNSAATLRPQIEAALADPVAAKSYGVVTAAAAVYLPDKPERALALLIQAEPLLPANDLREAYRFYGSLVDLLITLKKPSDAIAAQKRCVAATKRGQARLAMLELQSGNKVGFEASLKDLSLPDANEYEIDELADALLSPASTAPKESEGTQADTLLTAYLSAPRSRNVELELHARLMLGQSLVAQHQSEQAIKVLTVDAMKLVPRTPAAIGYYADIQQVARSIEQGNKPTK